MRPAVALLLLAAAAPAADWWEVTRDVTARLLDRDVGEWARGLEGQPMPRDARDLLVRFQVLHRAGHTDRLPEVVDALAAEGPDDVIDDLIDHKSLDLARRALERFAHVDRDTVERYVQACGDGVDEEWLEARVAANEVFFEPWFSLRVRRGTARPLLEKWAEGVRGQPTDLFAAKRYLRALHESKAADDPSWLADILRPRLAIESEEIAGFFMPGHPRVAASFLERSLAQPFTEEDGRRAALLMAMPMSPIEPWVRDRTKVALARAYQRAGEAAKAQAILEELARKHPDGLPPGLSGLAGQVQHDSGARVIEGRIRAKEPERRNDARYWLARAEYFVGRKEDAEARAAFDKALALAPPAMDKGRIVQAFAAYLASMGRHAEATQVREAALSDAEPGSDYAYGLIVSLLRSSDDRAAFPGPDDERLWRHLAARAVWHDERELLARMANRAADRPALWRRATALAAEGDPTRAVMLADAMIRLGECRPAIPLLRGALPRLASYPAYHARMLLFDALLREKDWKGAEAAVMVEDCDRLGQIAVAAAKAGEPSQALRIWERRTNLDRLSTDGLDEMIRAAGRDVVAKLYVTMQLRDGAFRIPASLRERLGLKP